MIALITYGKVICVIKAFNSMTETKNRVYGADFTVGNLKVIVGNHEKMSDQLSEDKYNEIREQYRECIAKFKKIPFPFWEFHCNCCEVVIDFAVEKGLPLPSIYD